MATKKAAAPVQAPVETPVEAEVEAPQYIALAGGWGLTPLGVWVVLDGDNALPQPPTVADVVSESVED